MRLFYFVWQNGGTRVRNLLAEFRFENTLNAFSSGSICLVADRLRLYLHLHCAGILFIAVTEDEVLLLILFAKDRALRQRIYHMYICTYMYMYGIC